MTVPWTAGRDPGDLTSDAQGAAEAIVDEIGAEGCVEDAAEDDGATAGVVTSGGGRVGAARAGGAVLQALAVDRPAGRQRVGRPLCPPSAAVAPLGLARAKAASSAAWRCSANSLAIMASW